MELGGRVVGTYNQNTLYGFYMYEILKGINKNILKY